MTKKTPEKTASSECPKCRAALRILPLPGEVAARFCAACRGAFLESKQLLYEFPDLPPSIPGHAWSCPGCGGTMTSMACFDGKLRLERCGACRGVWFDAGELLALRDMAGLGEIVGRRGPPERGEASPSLTGIFLTGFLALLLEAAQAVFVAVFGRDGRYGDYDGYVDFGDNDLDDGDA